ncbi:MAG: rod-binding protein [Thermodesulfobacteriota bacterium]|nr:rod-binding protein [Thermodesulfobacteriota bacterium]
MPDPINLSNIPVKTISLSNEIQRVKHSIKSGGAAFSGQRDAELKDTCCELESLFINYLLQEMRQTIDKSGFISGGRAEEIYTSMLDTHMAKQFAQKGGIGISSILMQQLKQNENVKK